MSNTKPHGDRELQLQVLLGQDNYNSWVRDFKLVAKSENVWGFYQGTDSIMIRPSRRDYHIPEPKKKYKTTDQEIAAAGQSSTQTTGTNSVIDPNTLKANIIQYRFDTKEWEKNDKLIRKACFLLPQWVDPSIRGNLSTYDNPKDAWDFLRSQYKMPDARARHIAFRKISNLRLEECQSIQEYLNKHELHKLDFTEAKGSLGDPRHILMIFEGLTSRYHELVVWTDVTNVSLKDITTKLLIYESMIKQHDAEKRARDKG